jgi:hypothetical protein
VAPVVLAVMKVRREPPTAVIPVTVALVDLPLVTAVTVMAYSAVVVPVSVEPFLSERQGH